MNNPPNRPRDDRRMHEGDKPGLGDKKERGKQEEVTLDHDASDESSTTDREQESALGGHVATRSKA